MHLHGRSPAPTLLDHQSAARSVAYQRDQGGSALPFRQETGSSRKQTQRHPESQLRKDGPQPACPVLYESVHITESNGQPKVLPPIPKFSGLGCAPVTEPITSGPPSRYRPRERLRRTGQQPYGLALIRTTQGPRHHSSLASRVERLVQVQVAAQPHARLADIPRRPVRRRRRPPCGEHGLDGKDRRVVNASDIDDSQPWPSHMRFVDRSHVQHYARARGWSSTGAEASPARGTR